VYRIDDFLLKLQAGHIYISLKLRIDFRSKFTACQFELLKIFATFGVEEEAIFARCTNKQASWKQCFKTR
jgi:hypothetical protein